MPVIKIYHLNILRDILGDKVKVELNGEATLSEVLNMACEGRKKARQHIFCKGKVNPNIAILINGTSVNHLEGLKTGVTDEDEIVILQTAAGG